MKITYFLSLLYLLIFGDTTTNKPVYDLRKKPTREDNLRSFNCWIARNFYIICLATIVILLIVFIIVCFSIVGASTLESGTYYNHIGDLA